MKFTFETAVYELGVRGVYFNVRGMRNIDSNDAGIEAFVTEQVARWTADLEKSEIIRGFSLLHRKVSNRAAKLAASSESLSAYRRTHGAIPRINGLVDVYNAISVRSGVAIGAHDLARVSGDIALRLTRGDETFWPLGASEPRKVPPGEYAYVDSSDDILCRMEVRQVEKTKVTLATRDAFFIVQAHAHADWVTVTEISEELKRACLGFFGGAVESLAVLGPAAPVIR